MNGVKKIKIKLTWSFGSTSQNSPQAEDDSSLILLHDLCAEKVHTDLYFSLSFVSNYPTVCIFQFNKYNLMRHPL